MVPGVIPDEAGAGSGMTPRRCRWAAGSGRESQRDMMRKKLPMVPPGPGVDRLGQGESSRSLMGPGLAAKVDPKRRGRHTARKRHIIIIIRFNPSC